MNRARSTPPLCPACGRHIGRVCACPYCEAETPYRRRLLLLRCIALLASIGGTMMLLAL